MDDRLAVRTKNVTLGLDLLLQIIVVKVCTVNVMDLVLAEVHSKFFQQQAYQLTTAAEVRHGLKVLQNGRATNGCEWIDANGCHTRRQTKQHTLDILQQTTHCLQHTLELLGHCSSSYAITHTHTQA